MKIVYVYVPKSLSLTAGSVKHANAEVKVYAYSMSPVTVKGKRLKE